MSQDDNQTGRVPLTATRAVSVFGISVVGFMTANLVPVMIVALTGERGFSDTEAGTLMTGSLLACAITCLLTSKPAAGSGRYAVARAGLVLTAAGFGAAAFIPSAPAVVAGVLIGGLGAGGAVSAGGAALGALRNPDRASGISGFTNRAIVSVVLFVIPALGAGMGSAFGLLAGLALAALFTTAWLPNRPGSGGTASTVPAATAVQVHAKSRTTTIAGFGLLACFADFTVLATDPLQADATELLTNSARLTVVGGEVAYDGGTSTASRPAAGAPRAGQPA